MRKTLLGIIATFVFCANALSTDFNSEVVNQNLNVSFHQKLDIFSFELASNLHKDKYNFEKGSSTNQFILGNRPVEHSKLINMNLSTNEVYDNRGNELKYLVGCTAVGALMGYLFNNGTKPKESTALTGGLLGLGVGIVYVFSF